MELKLFAVQKLPMIAVKQTKRGKSTLRTAGLKPI